MGPDHHTSHCVQRKVAGEKTLWLGRVQGCAFILDNTVYVLILIYIYIRTST